MMKAISVSTRTAFVAELLFLCRPTSCGHVRPAARRLSSRIIESLCRPPARPPPALLYTVSGVISHRGGRCTESVLFIAFVTSYLFIVYIYLTLSAKLPLPLPLTAPMSPSLRQAHTLPQVSSSTGAVAKLLRFQSHYNRRCAVEDGRPTGAPPPNTLPAQPPSPLALNANSKIIRSSHLATSIRCHLRRPTSRRSTRR